MGTIRELRLAKGWTIETLASILKVSRVTVWRWETGQSKPHPVHLERIKKLIK
jgi:transcriptional regulator with XRE-family HTH domain